MTITFDKLPGNLEELIALPYASLSEPEYSAALFVAVMMKVPTDYLLMRRVSLLTEWLTAATS